MRRIGGAYKIDGVDAAVLFLTDPLKDSLGSGALDARGNARILRITCSGQNLRDIQLERAVEGDLAFLARGFDQGWRCRLGFR
jgi:hypothetical protein